MTAMNETPDENLDHLDSPGNAVDNDAGESLDAADTKAPDDTPSQPAKIAPGMGRSANIGHT